MNSLLIDSGCSSPSGCLLRLEHITSLIRNFNTGKLNIGDKLLERVYEPRECLTISENCCVVYIVQAELILARIYEIALEELGST